eukprot:CAMPEP_0184680814 /NCGR_PEP_ID=MMETSP0312-20130426/3727_1 /TAXON_ID=31354 /ORGANISM="Compsopogon coeruleus, Strain SAG 36.94" /LENGTH=156 /DNA_ID=CAMNT_0027131195 /DNA_START=387 /DNA_END=857 /DNA_ORIENTATION=-
MVITVLVGCAYPVYGSYKALASNDREKQQSWLTYWVLFGVYHVLEVLVWPILRYLPFYYEIKLLVLVAMIHPKTDFAGKVYRKYVKSILAASEKTIDSNLDRAHSKLRPHLDVAADKVNIHLDKVLNSGPVATTNGTANGHHYGVPNGHPETKKVS